MTNRIFKVNDENDLEKVNPLPCCRFNDSFYFPADHRIAVTREGVIFNVKTKNVLKHHYTKSRNMVAITISSPNKRVMNYTIHRIMAITFVGRPSRHIDKSFSSLEVNHIDGDRQNNDIYNLEWVTGSENNLHAHMSGLISRDRIVLAKCLNTDEIKKFHSVKNCSEFFNIHRATLWKHLIHRNTEKYHKNYHIFKFDNDECWPDVDLNKIKTLGEQNPIEDVVVKSTSRNMTLVFNNFSDAAVEFNIPKVTLWRHLRKHGTYTKNGDTFSLCA